jgi:hypothetical protein
MRIVGGRLRGRTLQAPKSQAIRPTADRLRESLFNILAHAYGDPIRDARVLREQLGERIATLAGADFSDAPVTREKNAPRAPRRHPEARAGEAGEPRRAARPHREDRRDQGARDQDKRPADKRGPAKHDQGQRSGSPRRASDRARGKGRRPAHPAPSKKR